MTKALRITAVGRTHFVEVDSFADYQREVGGFVSAILLGDDHALIINGEATSGDYPNDLATATVAHLGSSNQNDGVIRGTVLIVRVDASGRWRDVDDGIDREICGLAALLRC